MAKDVVPILESGEYVGQTPGGYGGPTDLSVRANPAPVELEVVEEGGGVACRARVGGWFHAAVIGVVVSAFGVIATAGGAAASRRGSLIVMGGVACIIAGPLLAWGYVILQREARKKGPVLAWASEGAEVTVPRIGLRVAREAVLAFESVEFDRTWPGRIVLRRALVMVHRDGEGRVACQEVAFNIANAREVAEELCGRLGVGLHVVRLGREAGR